MITAAAIAFVALLIVQGVGTIAYLVLASQLLTQLRTNCPAVYESLGSPSLFFNSTPKNNMLLLEWLWRRDFDDVEDADTVHKAAVVRFILIALLGNMAMLVVTFAAFGVALNA